jgi:hypothetical protein
MTIVRQYRELIQEHALVSRYAFFVVGSGVSVFTLIQVGKVMDHWIVMGWVESKFYLVWIAFLLVACISMPFLRTRMYTFLSPWNDEPVRVAAMNAEAVLPDHFLESRPEGVSRREWYNLRAHGWAASNAAVNMAMHARVKMAFDPFTVADEGTIRAARIVMARWAEEQGMTDEQIVRHLATAETCFLAITPSDRQAYFYRHSYMRRLAMWIANSQLLFRVAILLLIGGLVQCIWIWVLDLMISKFSLVVSYLPWDMPMYLWQTDACEYAREVFPAKFVPSYCNKPIIVWFAEHLSVRMTPSIFIMVTMIHTLLNAFRAALSL